MHSSLSIPSFLAILVIIIVTVVWFSIATFSEGQKEIPSIKITSPTNGQNISATSNPTMSGNATGTNTAYPRCYGSVIVNNIKPYHNATAAGQNGVDDYSKWYYTLSTKSAAIKVGQNKLTGKLSCLQASSSNTNSTNVTNTTTNLIEWYSVNVTGVSTSTTSTVNRNNESVTNSSVDRPQQPQGNTTLSSNSTEITQPLIVIAQAILPHKT